MLERAAILTEDDIYLLNEGAHCRLREMLGAIKSKWRSKGGE